jgi:hypothetical protein
VTAGAIEAGRLGCVDGASAFAATVAAGAAGVAVAGVVALGWGAAEVAGEPEPVAATGGFAIGWTVAAADEAGAGDASAARGGALPGDAGPPLGSAGRRSISAGVDGERGAAAVAVASVAGGTVPASRPSSF